MLAFLKSAVLCALTPRSPFWPHARAIHLVNEPTCQWCGARWLLEVHHIIPFFLDRTLELEKKNLITLCMGVSKCHYVRGHLGKSWVAYDPDIREKCNQHRRQQWTSLS